MNTVFDYLDWRGDLNLRAHPFNPVDNLILSVLSYIPFDGILVPGGQKTGMPLAEAARQFASNKMNDHAIRAAEDVQLLERLALSPRYSSMTVCNYVHSTDYALEKQFAALTILTGDRHIFVSFRGTDLSLIGWKEDFNMSFRTPVPAQEAARDYLEETARLVSGKMRVGGHSKGGNLAVYAAAHVSPRIQKRIHSVYTNDGPGFSPVVIESAGYRAIRGRIYSFIPESSIIGMLLEHDEDYTVVQSSQRGLLQHDPYSWETRANDFVRLHNVDSSSRFIDRTIRDWLRKLDIDKREIFFGAFYEVVSATGASTIHELTADWLKSAKAIAKGLVKLESSDRTVLLDGLGILAHAAGKEIGHSLNRKTRRR